MEGKDSPLITVIIPTFNRISLLKETVDSVRNQSFRDFEIIVVNDGSTDGTGEWLRDQTDLRVIEQSNLGIATARNNGAAAAKGDWLAFLDHDDLWAPDKLLIQAEFVRNNPDVALVAVRHVRLGEPNRGPKKSSVDQGRSISERIFPKFHPYVFSHDTPRHIRTDWRLPDEISIRR